MAARRMSILALLGALLCACGATEQPSLRAISESDRKVERQALLDFYRALAGADWIQRDHWGSERPVSEWHGVFTDQEGHVVRLKLYDNNLVGTLSPALGKLSQLDTLHLSLKSISGSIPDELGDCRALQNLWLKSNKLEGALPDSIATLPHLLYLDVHANALSGPLPSAWDTPSLEIFRAEGNRLSGALPAQLFLQPKRTEVFFFDNDFSGSLPESLGSCQSMKRLLLAHNRFTGTIPEGVGRLARLADLRLNDNALTGAIPASLVTAPALEVLRLDGNRLTGPVPPGLAERLSTFDFSGNPTSIGNEGKRQGLGRGTASGHFCLHPCGGGAHRVSVGRRRT